jgi:DNA helicase-2/ATP-dependent DNA helicase PcrA
MATTLDSLNPEQVTAVTTTHGSVLLVAGPGAGKTLTLVRRTLHLIQQGLAIPEQVVLCTFTEKAALEIRDRLRSNAIDLGINLDLSGLRTGTIHGICNQFIDQYRHLTRLGNGYEVLDQLTQKLFVNDHFDEIIGEPIDGKFLSKWTTRWTAIEGVLRYIDKMTEEMVDVGAMSHSVEPFHQALARAHTAYEELLVEENKIDFSHLQTTFLQLLDDPIVNATITDSIHYVMVDEFQDTNYVQEQIVERLSARSGNLCVVGDEDQALYRFRGATVRNILEFPVHHPDASVIRLTTNYRSHCQIIDAYDSWMNSIDWENHTGGPPFRFDKHISAPESMEFPSYPAVLSIWGTNPKDEGKRFADLVKFLLDEEIVEDASQIALLLRSVQSKHSKPYLDALDKVGVPWFCPRARGYFENDEVMAAIACLALVFDWTGENRGDASGRTIKELASEIDSALAVLAKSHRDPSPLTGLLQELHQLVGALREEDVIDLRPADVVYRLLAVEPFTEWMTNENRARNLATLTTLLDVFQRYYRFPVTSGRNLRALRMQLFNSFFRLLHDGGINEYEDPDDPFPKGHVQVMTIHQAKGLEFPVVVVGSLAVQVNAQKEIERVLGPFSNRPMFEPEDRITEFDRMRLHYVAFSRPQKLLVLTSTDEPKRHFDPIWQGLPQWPYVEKELLRAQGFDYQERIAPKKGYSFTGDLKVYETCPRQYEMYRHFEFTPSRATVIFFGLLVHQTIEDVHRLVLDGRIGEVTDERIVEMFEFNYRHLAKRDVGPITPQAKEAALRHVTDYVRNNREEMTRVIETEVDVSLEKDDYILTGAVDLVMSHESSLDVLDFKALKRPKDDDPILETYYQQLCVYAHILEQRYGRRPDRLVLYWTGESDRSRAVMEFEYRPEDVAAAIEHFDEVVARIESRNFAVTEPPGSGTCNSCDFNPFCISTGTINAEEAS